MPCGMTLDDFLPLRFPPTLKDRLDIFISLRRGFPPLAIWRSPECLSMVLVWAAPAHKKISQTFDGLSLPSLDALRRLFERSES